MTHEKVYEIDSKKQILTDIKFLKMAINMHPHMPRMTGFTVIGEKIYSTDGRRMHIAKTKENPLQDGFYKIISVKKNLILVSSMSDLPGTPIDFERVIPSSTPLKTFSINESVVERIFFKIFKETSQIFNLKYLEPLKNKTCQVSFFGEKKALKVDIDSGMHTIVSMPLRSDDL